MQQSRKHQVTIGGHDITFETGKMARQAAGSVVVRAGGTVVLVTAQGAREPRPGLGFLPLTVDYQERMSAAGRIPGGFFKREGKPRDDETLTSRIIDRSIRPRFAEGWACETQVIATVFSADAAHPADALALCGASLALELSDLPFVGPIAGIRVCRVDGALVCNPSHQAKAGADINLFVACSEDAIVMVEGGSSQVAEADIIDALLFAHAEAQPIIAMQRAMAREAGLAKREVIAPTVDTQLVEKVRQLSEPGLAQALALREKLPRYAALDQVRAQVVAALAADPTFSDRADRASAVLSDLRYAAVRGAIVEQGSRIDGRRLDEVRPIHGETGILPRCHGSALFTRGETQALVSVTLGTRQDEQKIDDLLGERYRNFLLHYNFPPYSVGETKFLRGPGRREIGHGALAERALTGMIATPEDFPYVVRIVSDILESNGSSSMATVCGGSMAMMDAGVPIDEACAGIAMGLIQEGDKIAILSDILGDEDHLGDMDFKVAGTARGITAIQMDIKVTGVSKQILAAALEQARVGRLHILGEMAKTIAATRAEMSAHAPRITLLRIKQDRIRDIIGPGGKVIKDLQARTGCLINVEDEGDHGLVQVASSDSEASRRAIKMIQDLTQEAEMGRTYIGNVRKITDFGAFVEIFPGTDGLVHISELANKHVERVEDVLQEGDELKVKVIGIEKGKVRLSRRAVLAEEQAQRAARQGAEAAQGATVIVG